MRQINFGTTLGLLLTILLLSSCSSLRPEPQIVIQTKIIEKTIPVVQHPKPVNLSDVKIYVVAPEKNFDEFIQEYTAKNGGDSYIAISVKDYENLSTNFAELRRYIEQQKDIIVYYEKAVAPSENVGDDIIEGEE
jgi:hypothetical protein